MAQLQVSWASAAQGRWNSPSEWNPNRSGAALRLWFPATKLSTSLDPSSSSACSRDDGSGAREIVGTCDNIGTCSAKDEDEQPVAPSFGKNMENSVEKPRKQIGKK